MVTGEEAILFTDFRYTKQAKEQSQGVELVEITSRWVEEIFEILKKKGIKKIGFEKEYISYSLYSLFKNKWTGISFKPVNSAVTAFRAVKDQEEIDAIINSVELADKAFKHILAEIKPGRKEREIALELEYFMRKEGAEGISFDFIVASGIRGAMPHGVASEKKLKEGEMVTLDFGCVLKGYCSDISRTVVLGDPSEKQKEIYSLVNAAQSLGLESLRPGIKAEDADKKVRDYFSLKGYGDFFGHGLGHGVGMEVHEAPRLAPCSEDELIPGMVVTVEPGLYIDGFGGVRIEDMALITSEGYQVLTKSSKEFIQI